MPANINLLTTRAECDEALVDLDAELDGYQNRDSNIEYADRRTSRTAASANARLAGLNARIASYTNTLAQPDLDAATRRSTEEALETATYQRNRLARRAGARTGAVAFLTEVDAEQIAMQVQVLTDAKTAVTAHRATLPA